MNDKISVIIPVKNEEAKIEQCLEAVFNRTIKPFEVIVVDGHSIKQQGMRESLYKSILK